MQTTSGQGISRHIDCNNVKLNPFQRYDRLYALCANTGVWNDINPNLHPTYFLSVSHKMKAGVACPESVSTLNSVYKHWQLVSAVIKTYRL